MPKRRDSTSGAATTEARPAPTVQIQTAGVIEKMLKTQRANPNIPPPNWEDIPRSSVFDAQGLPIMENLRAHFAREGLLSEADALEIINRAAALLRKEPNLIRLNDPITVCGDIHGQFYDLLKLLEIGGDPADMQYLFLGDYVDRGCFGCEVVLYLFGFKIRYPSKFFMLRGNHECRHLTAYFNSKKETKYKYSQAVYDAMMSAFDCLPLACILNKRFLCVHGGLSPEIKTVEEMNAIHRFREPPSSGPMCDLLWADPMEDDNSNNTGNSNAMFVHNDLRGCSFVFSFAATCHFLSTNKLLSVIRAHEAQDEGYRLYRRSPTGFPSVICIFSAPNYCDTYENKAAIIRFQDNLMNIRQFNSSPHPYYLPNFMNAFTWSLPFVAEKVADLLTTIWQLCEPTEGLPEEGGDRSRVEERSQHIRKKILAMGKMAKMFKTLREENESIIELKGLAGGQLPMGVIQQGPEAIRKAISGFEQAKMIDSSNEKRPEFTP